jgi:hypothetical protein
VRAFRTLEPASSYGVISKHGVEAFSVSQENKPEATLQFTRCEGKGMSKCM